ncbi:MAG: sulfite exporter TauE/SafE family protein, partial [Bacteroidetes bacterium]|nr:sulfite exporter TauE/SafE family protein [Bacteroidota bacterium]
APECMKPIALVLNLLVSGIAFIQFYRQGHFLWRLFLPIALFSVPMAYWGGLTPLKDIWYQRGLGIFLLVSVVMMLWPRRSETSILFPFSASVSGASDAVDSVNNGRGWWNKETGIAAFMGAIIGYVSGLLGIGGGILLSPVLLMIRWTQQKQTAAISSAFIFVNSASGLLGFVQQHTPWVITAQKTGDLMGLGMAVDAGWYIVAMILCYLILPVLLGGLMGSWYGAKKFNQTVMKYILCAVLLIAAIKLLL